MAEEYYKKKSVHQSTLTSVTAKKNQMLGIPKSFTKSDYSWTLPPGVIMLRYYTIIRGESVFPWKITRECRVLDSIRLPSHDSGLFLCQNNIYNHSETSDRLQQRENIQASPLTADCLLVDMIDWRWVQICWVYKASPWAMSLWGCIMTVQSSGSSPSWPEIQNECNSLEWMTDRVRVSWSYTHDCLQNKCIPL